MVEATVVPESLRLDPLLSLLRGEGFQMAIVSDEYGGTAGVVTLEDVVEEIVGDIADEHDRYGSRLRQRPDGAWIVSGLLRPDEVRDATGLDLPEDEAYDTVAGLLVRELGRIPERGDQVLVPLPVVIPDDDDEEPVQEHVLMRVERMDGLRVDRDLAEAAARPRRDRSRHEHPGRDAGSASCCCSATRSSSAAEFALVSARRTKIEPKAAAGSRVARTTLRAMEGLSQMIAAAQFGITVCSLGLGAVAEPALAHLIEPLADAVNLPGRVAAPGGVHRSRWRCVVYLHVVLGEMVPKNLALAGPERAAMVLGPPMMALVTVLKPIVYGLDAVANGVVRLMGVEPRTRGHLDVHARGGRGDGRRVPRRGDARGG